jgi:CRISPR/Cas system-associated exonuclease Cas4 (RecB family)
MSLRLSNSQINTYLDCPRKWKLQKLDRLRPNWTTSALLFGSALDAAVESILLKEDKDPLDVFNEEMDLAGLEVNGKVHESFYDAIYHVRYSAGDVDHRLLTDTVRERIRTVAANRDVEFGDFDEFLEFCKKKRKQRKALKKDEQFIYNIIAHNSLLSKGQLAIPVVAEWIEENVQEVHSVQKMIEIENVLGDRFIGYLDFIVTLKDKDCTRCQGTGFSWDDAENRERVCDHCNPKKVLIDLKTSSDPNKYYPAEAATRSRQLAIYAMEEGIDHVAYLVIDKKIRVREPRVRLKFVEGIITEEHLDEVFDEIEDVTLAIKDGEFPKNEDSCFNYGGCEYKDFCKFGKKTGLEYVK